MKQHIRSILLAIGMILGITVVAILLIVDTKGNYPIVKPNSLLAQPPSVASTASQVSQQPTVIVNQNNTVEASDPKPTAIAPQTTVINTAQAEKDFNECVALQKANGQLAGGSPMSQAHNCVETEMSTIRSKISAGQGTPAMESALQTAINLGY